MLTAQVKHSIFDGELVKIQKPLVAMSASGNPTLYWYD
jgi:hypothetical protein